MTDQFIGAEQEIGAIENIFVNPRADGKIRCDATIDSADRIFIKSIGIQTCAGQCKDEIVKQGDGLERRDNDIECR